MLCLLQEMIINITSILGLLINRKLINDRIETITFQYAMHTDQKIRVLFSCIKNGIYLIL